MAALRKGKHGPPGPEDRQREEESRRPCGQSDHRLVIQLAGVVLPANSLRFCETVFARL